MASVNESKHILIEQKVPGLYHESQYIMDYLVASLTVKYQKPSYGLYLP